MEFKNNITNWFGSFGKDSTVRVFNAGNITPEKTMPFLPSWFWNAELGVPRSVNFVETRLYAKSAWVQMVENAISKQIMTTPWEIDNTDEEDETDYSEDETKLRSLLEHPNVNGDTFWDIWAPPIRDVMEIDAGIVFKGRDTKGEIVELYTYDAATFLISPDQHGRLLRYYQYSFKHFGAKPIPFEKEDIIYMMMNKSNELFPYGYSPLMSIQQEVELMIQSTRYNKEFFQNNAIPDGLVGIDMDDDKFDRFKDEWEKSIKGKPHKLLFHNTSGIKFEPLKISNKDMDWLDGQKWYFHTVFGAFGLSPQEVGFYENSNKSTGESQERITVKNAVKPYLDLIASKINREIAVDLLGHDNLCFKFILTDSAAEKNEHDQTIQKLTANVYTINEVRAKEGKEPVEWGEQPMAFSTQDRFVEAGGSKRTDGTSEEFGNPKKDDDKDKDDKKDRDKKKEDREKEKRFIKFLKIKSGG